MALGLLILRLVVGPTMAAHGAQKLFGWFGGYGLAGTGGFLEKLGFVPGRRHALFAGLAELMGGLRGGPARRPKGSRHSESELASRHERAPPRSSGSRRPVAPPGYRAHRFGKARRARRPPVGGRALRVGGRSAWRRSDG